MLNSLPAISDGTKPPIGPLSQSLASQAEQSTLLGAQLSSSFMGSTDVTVKIVTVVLIVLMSATTFTTQRQLMMKNMPATSLDNPFAKQQKMLLYLMPLFFAISGINFPIGVLLYWLTTNLWSMGQQFYVIRRMPAPGSLAEKALEERRMKSGKAHKKFTIPGLHSGDVQDTVEETPAEPAKPITGQRQQPKRKKRNRPAPPAGSKPGAASGSPSAPERSTTGGDSTPASRDV